MKVNYQKVITQQPTELKQIQNQPNHITGFRKLQALYLLKTGHVQTVSNLSNYLGVHRVTIQRWLTIYREQGLSKLLAVKPRSGRPRKMTSSVIATLQKRVQDQNRGFNSYGEIPSWLETNYQIKVKYHTLYHWLRYQLKAKLKVPRKSAAHQDEGAQQEFQKNFQS